ncbi:HAD hydrolase family protein, partial [Staphylococcus capitis]|uniref:HAD hydrolase family protein n=1 Tax=Staphylococcus capitis TaxID=29388 RepID=UPI003709BFB7
MHNPTLKILHNYHKIQHIPPQLIIKILPFHSHLPKIHLLPQELPQSPNLPLSSSSTPNLQITHSHPQKRIPLSTIPKQLPIHLKHLIPLPHNLNHLSILQTLAYSLPMHNPPPQLNTLPNYLTHSNENSPLPKAINKFL